MAGDVIRIVLADDHAIVRAGLKAVLREAKDIEIVGEASTGREALALVQQLEPDVLVSDLTMPELDGTATTREIVAQKLRTRVLILTMHAEEEFLVSVIKAGAAGYLVKTDADRELVKAIRAVAWGDLYVRPSAGGLLAKQFARKNTAPTEQEQFQKLTDRERSVLQLVGQGYSAPEIAEHLFISPKTVDTYKQRIQEKLNITHRSHYVQFALRLGLLARN